MEMHFIPFTLVLLSLIFNHRYTRHWLALVGGVGLVWMYQFSSTEEVTRFDFYFGVGLSIINLSFVAWQTWLFVMPLNADEDFYYRNYITNFSKENFKKLMDISKKENKSGGSTIVYERSKMDRILLVVDGSASVLIGKNKVAQLKNGDLIGEMSFLSGHVATATVRSDDLTTYLVWDQQELRNLLKKNRIDYSESGHFGGVVLIPYNPTIKYQ